MATNDKKFKNGIQVEGKIKLPNESASKALTVSATGEVTSSTTTDTELSYVSGVTSAIQTQINAKASNASVQAVQDEVDALEVRVTDLEDGAALDVQAITDLQTLSGVPANSVDLGTFAGTIIPDAATVKSALQSLESFIASLPDPMEYKGLWNASTNTPALTDGTGNNGDVYRVSVAGTQFTPTISFEVGDSAVYNGATGKYEKWDMTDAVSSVFGRSGAVIAQSGDYTTDLVTEATSLYFTDTRAQTAAVVDSTAGNETVQAASVASMKAYVLAQVGSAGSPGDLSEASAPLLNNQTSPTNVTGLAFSASVVRSFDALVSVEIDATSGLYEVFKLVGINVGGTFSMSVESNGSDSGVVFDITGAGQVTYQSANVAGFTSGAIKYRALTTSV